MFSGRYVGSLWWIGWAAVVAIGCAPEKPSDGEATELRVEAGDGAELEDGEAVVARINGEPITREEFNRRIDGLAEFARMRLQSVENRRDFLGSIVEFEMMADEAELRGYGAHPRVRHAISEVMVELMIEDHLRNEVSMAAIDDEAREQYFERWASKWQEPERRRLARLVVDDRHRAEELVERWRDKMEGFEGDVARDFREFSFHHSRERSTGDRGGDAGWYTAEQEFRFGEDIFAWQPETLQGPFEDEQGRWVLKMVIEVEEQRQATREEVEQQITAQIYEERRQQARQELVEGLTAGADVEVWNERIEGFESPPQLVAPRLDEIPRPASSELGEDREPANQGNGARHEE